MRSFLIFVSMIIVSLLITYIIYLNNHIKVLKSYNYDIKINDLTKEYNNLYNKIVSNFKLENKDDFHSLVDVLNNEYNSLIEETDSLKKTKKSLDEQLKTLNKQYNKLLQQKQQQEEAEKNKNTFIIENVSKINQYNVGYPTGCESAALTILLNYNNVNVSMDEVVEKLAKGRKPYYENGILFGGNPYLEFVGNPKDKNSYGVYDKPIEDVANVFKPGIINDTGKSLDEILTIVSQNRPVIVWNSMNLAVPYISSSWIYKDTGEKISWLAQEHAIVIIGYTESEIITSDSLTGTIRYFNKNKFENRYNIFGKRALYY